MVILERREVADDLSRRGMELAAEAASGCASPRVQMTAWLLAGDLDQLERHAHGNLEAATLCALAGVGDRETVGDALRASARYGHAALVFDDAGLHDKAAHSWLEFQQLAAAGGNRYLKGVGRLREARARARADSEQGPSPILDSAARALEVLADSFVQGGREDRAYQCYAAAAAYLDRGYMRWPVLQSKLRDLAVDCLLPAFVCQVEAELVANAISAKHHARAEILAKRAQAYAESWQPHWAKYFSGIRGASLGTPPRTPEVPIYEYSPRGLEMDILEFETRADPSVLLGWALLDRSLSERDRRLAGALRLHLHLHEGEWADDETVRFIEACSRMSGRVAEALIERFVDHASPRVREAAVVAAPTDSRRALGWLRTLGGDSSRSVREAAAHAIAKHRSASSIVALITMWETARSEQIADATVKALAEIRRVGAPQLGVPRADDFDRLLESRTRSSSEQIGQLVAQVRQRSGHV